MSYSNAGTVNMAVASLMWHPIAWSGSSLKVSTDVGMADENRGVKANKATSANQKRGGVKT